MKQPSQIVRLISVSLLVFFSLHSSLCSAHEVRPAYLDVQAQAENHYRVFWKVPSLAEARLALSIQWPEGCLIKGIPDTRNHDGTIIERYTLSCARPLEGQSISIQGLEKTLTDTLLKYTNLDKQVQSGRLTPSATQLLIDSEPGPWQVLSTYFSLGVEHILLGIDHLLFVICLLFIAGGFKRVMITITGFTIAHSITLIASALNLVTLNPAPVEAVIALSIVFLAREIFIANKTSLAYRFPLSVALIFGLLHGFGFAAALGSIGLPYNDQLLALLMFNVGVEAGQVSFIVLVIGAYHLLRKLFTQSQQQQFVYTANLIIGGLASYWFLSRLMAI